MHSQHRRKLIRNQKRLLTPLVTFALSVVSHSQTWHFDIDQNNSGLKGKACFDALLTGTLQGTWDTNSNPNGTMTKPGLIGDFGADENLPVKVEPKLRMFGKVDMRTSGSFNFTVNLDKKEASANNFSADLLANGDVDLVVQLSPRNEPFKTKNPSGKFRRVEDWLKAGTAKLTKFQLNQSGATKKWFVRKMDNVPFVIAWAMIPVHVSVVINDAYGDHNLEFEGSYAVGGKLVTDGGSVTLSTNSEQGRSGWSQYLNVHLDPRKMQITGKRDAKGEVVFDLFMKKLSFAGEGMRKFRAVASST